MTTPNKFNIQDEQYVFPYHHLVGFSPFTNYQVMSWGFEYYAYTSEVLEKITSEPFTSILDVGCGEGKMILELSKRIKNIKMKGIDLSDKAILFAKAFNYGNGAEFVCEDISVTEGAFDVVTLIETIEHVPDTEIQAFVNAIYDRTVRGGRVIVTVPTINFPLINKHYRHYDLALLISQFPQLTLESSVFMVKQGFMYLVLIRLSRKFASFSLLRKFFFRVAQKLLFLAIPTTGRHLVAVFRKP